MDLILIRFGSTPMGTFGELIVTKGDVSNSFSTVEQPWRNNQPTISSIPLGKYKLIWRPTTCTVPSKYSGNTWYIVGGTVGINEGDRKKCCIHIGNTSSDVSGCIAVGLGLGTIGSTWAIMQSTNGLIMLYDLIGPGDHDLEIRSIPCG